MTSMKERYGFIILGNSGVGKSFLANLFLQNQNKEFEHQASATAVTTVTEFVEYTNENKTHVIFNIPGLVEADQEKIETNKIEIDKAFAECPNAIVIYVFGTQTGRIRNEDVIAFNAINEAYSFDQKSLVLVVNGIPRQNLSLNYEGETIVLLEKMLKTKLPKNICFLDDIDPSNSRQKDQLREKLLKAVTDAVPKVYKKQRDICLQADEVNKLKDELRQITTAFNEKREVLETQFEEGQRLYKEEMKVLRQRYDDLQQQKAGSTSWLSRLVKPAAKLYGTTVGAIGGLITGEDPEKAADEMSEKMALIGQSPTYSPQCNYQPMVYIIDLVLPTMDWDPDIATLKTYNTNNQLADAMLQSNSVVPSYVLASKPPSYKIMSYGHLLHYYYVNTSPNEHAETDAKGNGRVTNLDSINHFASELFGDLGQYYRDKAQESLFDHQDRIEAKHLLKKSKRCFEILNRDIERTLKHYNDLSVL